MTRHPCRYLCLPLSIHLCRLHLSIQFCRLLDFFFLYSLAICFSLFYFVVCFLLCIHLQCLLLSLHFRVLLSKILCRLLRCRHDSRSGVGGLGPGSVLSDLVRWFLRLLGVVPPLHPRPDGGGYHAVVGSRIRGGLGAFLHFIHHHCMPELI